MHVCRITTCLCFCLEARDASDVFGAEKGNDSIRNHVGLESLEAAMHDDFSGLSLGGLVRRPSESEQGHDTRQKREKQCYCLLSIRQCLLNSISLVSASACLRYAEVSDTTAYEIALFREPNI